MIQLLLRARRLPARSIIAPVVMLSVCAAVTCGGASNALGATITGNVYDLRLLGHVQNASGTVLSTEGYTASPVFNPTSTNLTNNVVPTPIPPLLPTKVLRVDESEAAGTAIIWIRGPASNPSHTFANILDPNFDVELELTLRFDGLGLNEGIEISNVKPENGAHGFYTPVSFTQSGTGTDADPLRLLVLLDPADLQGTFLTSHVKLHFDYDEIDLPIIPEPTAAVMILLGLASCWTVKRRGQRN